MHRLSSQSEEIICLVFQNIALVLLLAETRWFSFLDGMSNAINKTLNIGTNGMGTEVVEWGSGIGALVLLVCNIGLGYLVIEYYKYGIDKTDKSKYKGSKSHEK